MDHLSAKDWDETIAVNLTAPFALGQKFGPAMAKMGSGRIINIVSQQSFRAFGNSSVYGASKGGLVSLTRSQGEAWSSRGVLCNAIAPGLVDTAMATAVLRDPAKAESHAMRTMIRRNGVAEDLGGDCCVSSPVTQARLLQVGFSLLMKVTRRHNCSN